MKKTKEIEPVLVWSDPEAMQRAVDKVYNGLQNMQAIMAAWKAIPGLPEMNDGHHHDLFQNRQDLVNRLSREYYQKTYAAAHEAIGIGQEKGMGLVSDKLPDCSALLKAVNDANTTFDYYKLENGQFVVNPQHIEDIKQGHSLYLTTAAELKVKELVDNLVGALRDMKEVIPPQVFRFDNGGFGDVDLNILREIFDVSTPSYQNYPTITARRMFYAKLHQYAINNNLS